MLIKNASDVICFYELGQSLYAHIKVNFFPAGYLKNETEITTFITIHFTLLPQLLPKNASEVVGCAGRQKSVPLPCNI